MKFNLVSWEEIVLPESANLHIGTLSALLTPPAHGFKRVFSQYAVDPCQSGTKCALRVSQFVYDYGRPSKVIWWIDMVGAISSSTSAAVTLTSSSGGNSLSALEAQLSAKESELSEAADEDAKAELKDAIATLKAEIAALKAAKETSSTQQQAAQTSESENTSRIGTRNFEDGDPFGEREMYV